MSRQLVPFAVASGLPAVLLLIGGIAGGWWILLAFAMMTAVTFALDQLVTRTPQVVAEDPAALRDADRLSVALALAHFALLFLALAAVSGATGLSWPERIVAFFAFGLYFGQVSNSNAHELIHRNNSALFNLGMWVYISVLFGHHTSSHRLVHHRFVATADDPNTAEKGESFYAFLPRAWWGSFIAGYEMERNLRSGSGDRSPSPYLAYVGGALALLAASAAVFGFGGLIAYLLLAGYAQAQLLLSDYVQHYGLKRYELPGGRPEAVRSCHSWNAPHWFSSAMMLNAPRHSDHHAHPARPYPALSMPKPEEAPVLPLSLPAMATLALYPRGWRRVMDPRLAQWEQRKAAA